jgi:hypothetical protein
MTATDDRGASAAVAREAELMAVVERLGWESMRVNFRLEFV